MKGLFKRKITGKAFNLSRGFTLVELLVVIAIIGILATMLLLQLGTARAKARDAKRIADVNQVASALELYYNDAASYPSVTNLKPLLVDGATKYLGRIPVDPLAPSCTADYNGTGGCYGYAFSPTSGPATRYQVWAELETLNKALDNDANINSTGWGGAPVNGDAKLCTTTSATDCVFDLGQ